jgi:hypothetical protein
MNATMQEAHIAKRETPTGRWVPAAFYLVNLFGWTVSAATAGAWDLLWLVVLPLVPLVMYLVRTRRTAA